MSREIYRYSSSRRRLLKATAATSALAAVGFPAPAILAQQRSLKVGTYGGYFTDSFLEHIFPEFTAATGIEVESVPEPTGEAWLVQLETAARAGQAPADVSMMAQVAMLRGTKGELWQALDPAKMPNVEKVFPSFINTYEDGRISGVAAVAWFITLVTNTDVYPEAPTSWAALWDPANENSVGLLALASNSFLLEITRATYFADRSGILSTRDGVMEVLTKIAELKPNVALWYRDEGQFQNALQSGEIPMGQYYHDVAGLAAADGFPVRSTFPEEGGVADRGSWAVSRASTKLEEAQIFIDYMCQPSVQEVLSRKVGTAPIIPRDQLSLTDEEFAAVSSEIEPIIPEYRLYTEDGDWVNEQWTTMITA